MQLFRDEKKIKHLTKASALLCGLVLVPLMAFSNADEMEKVDAQGAPKRLNPFLMPMLGFSGIKGFGLFNAP